MTEIPVNPDVLKWARMYRRLSEEEAAARLGIDIESLRGLERGTQRPNLTMFEDISKKYKLPLSTLFRRTRPDDPPEPVDFRTLGGGQSSRTFELSVAISKARELLTQLDRVAQDDAEYSLPALPKYSSSENPGELGERERLRIGLTFEEQRSWKSNADAFRQWRRLIEKQGVSVFLEKYPVDDCRGFTLYDQGRPPCIIVNKSEDSEVAKIFTLAHEYAHLLIRQPGISDESRQNPTEAFCNRFAAGFLMPKQALRELLPFWPNEPVDWSDSEIAAWAKVLKVSRRALAIRLIELGLAPKGSSDRYEREDYQSKPKADFGNAVTARINEIGSNYARVVLGAYDRGVITLSDAVEALALQSRHFPKVRKSISLGDGARL